MFLDCCPRRFAHAIEQANAAGLRPDGKQHGKQTRTAGSLSRTSHAGILLLALLIHVGVLAIFALTPQRELELPKPRNAIRVQLVPKITSASPRPAQSDRAIQKNESRAARTHITADSAHVPQATKPSAPMANSTTVEPPEAQARAESIPAASSGQLIHDALRSAGKIDRDLRQQQPRKPNEEQQSKANRLERSIAAAARKGLNATEEKLLPDGTRVTKVYGATGTYCIYSRGAGTTAGLDPAQEGARTFTANCMQ